MPELTICPVCLNSLDPVTNARARHIGQEWFHEACSRFAMHVADGYAYRYHNCIQFIRGQEDAPILRIR